MKNLQRGFVIPLILTIVAFLLVVGGVYMYKQKEQPNKPVTGSSATQTTQSIPTVQTTQTTQPTPTTKNPSAISPQRTPSAVTASIDQSSLTATSPTPTITGTASSVSRINVSINDQYGCIPSPGDFLSVSNGRWTFTVPPSFPLQNGTYIVSIDYVPVGDDVGQLLTKGTLIVNAPIQATPPVYSATIDSSSLTTTTAPPSYYGTITGTATNLYEVYVKIENARGHDDITGYGVTDGKWSAVVVNYPPGFYPPGSYPVEVYAYNPEIPQCSDIYKLPKQPLATGTLTVTD